MSRITRRLVDRLVAERRRVRAVVGDQALDLAVADLHALEQSLGDLHRPARREPELAARFLRQRRRREGGRGPLDAGPCLDAGHAPRQVALERQRQRTSGGFVEMPDALGFQCSSG